MRGFCDKWIGWIEACISTVTYQVLINGKRTRTIRPTRGLRQGDPLSPYLFILVVDVLSNMMEEQVAARNILGIRPKNGCPEIHHIFFADDSLFFIKGGVEKARNLKRVLDTYCEHSGQLVNYSKSSIYFSPTVDEGLKNEISGVFGVQRRADPGSYLGLPTQWGRSKKEALGYLRERIRDKIQSWRNRLLNQAGKEVLMKAVVTVIPSYVMNVFKFPLTWCSEINVMIARLW